VLDVSECYLFRNELTENQRKIGYSHDDHDERNRAAIGSDQGKFAQPLPELFREGRAAKGASEDPGLACRRSDKLAAAAATQGDLDKARSALAESLRLRPAMKSIARMRAENPWLGNPQYWALQEKTLNLGLRRAGLPDQ
jgi:hypothetical protein